MSTLRKAANRLAYLIASDNLEAAKVEHDMCVNRGQVAWEKKLVAQIAFEVARDAMVSGR